MVKLILVYFILKLSFVKKDQILTQAKRHLIFRWATPKNFLATILFVIVVGLIEYTITVNFATGVDELTVIVLPLLNIEISPFHHLLPASAIISLTACFVHFTTHTAIVQPKGKPSRKPYSSKTKPRFKIIRDSWRRIVRVGGRMKRRILQNQSIAYVSRQLSAVKPLIRGGVVVIVAFTFIVLLVSIAAYPKLVKTSVTGLFAGNEGLFGFVVGTIRASEDIGNAVPPIGALAASVQGGLAAVAPAFRSSLESAGSTLTAGLVSLKPIEKYIVAQNVAVWIVMTITLLYSRHLKFRIFKH